MRLVASVLALAGFAVVVSAGRTAHQAHPGRNGHIVFSSDGDLWTIRPDGRGLPRLTKTSLEERCPSWSPSGRWIAFTQRGVRPADLYVMRADGSAKRRVAHTVGSDFCPSWSPDGRRLVFVSLHVASTGGHHDVFTIGVNGRALRRLTRQEEAWEVASWSRRGRIAYVDAKSALDGSDIWTMRADGSDQRRLTRAVREWNTEPDWSPDGSRIVYVNNLQSYGAVHTMNSDGTGVRRLTNAPGITSETSPAWSPDGRRLTFSRGQIYTMNVDGTGLRQLTRLRRGAGEPDWGPR
jgi:Tol biopolymer transport system component